MLNIAEIEKRLKSSITPKVQNTSRIKLAAVLIIISGKEPTIIMTERPHTMNYHAGEISFPGGTWKEKDVDLLETAIRETKEELGIEIPRSMIIGQLKRVTTLNSGFEITPFITVLKQIPKFSPNSEIASILRIPLLLLLDTMEYDRDPTHRSIQEMYTFKFKEHVIWGATARILNQMMTKIS